MMSKVNLTLTLRSITGERGTNQYKLGPGMDLFGSPFPALAPFSLICFVIPRRLSPGESFFISSPLSSLFLGLRRSITAEGREIKLAEGSLLSPLPPGLLQFSHPLFDLPPSVIRMLSKKPPLDSIFDTISRLAEKSGAAILGTVGKSGGRISLRSLLSYP